jgi:site-specific DNA-methyltransferase (adenine-specific)
MTYKIHNGNNCDILKEYPDCHVDAIVTDPPYGIEFLGKDWDKNTGTIETWKECLRVLKPGGHLLAFSSARTYHILATNIQEVGFDIRDQIMWLYASGFPKAQDIGKAIDKRKGNIHKTPQYQQNTPESEIKTMKSVGCIICGTRSVDPNGSGKYYCGHSQDPKLIDPQAQQWHGWKTAVKPAHEPIVMARKPYKGSTIDNVLKNGVGALNINATRIPFESDKDYKSSLGFNDKYEGVVRDGGPLFQGTKKKEKIQTGAKTPTKSNWERFNPEDRTTKDSIRQAQDPNKDKWKQNDQGRYPSNVIGEVKDYQKYFYCPKVSRQERHCGFEAAITNPQMLEKLGGYYCDIVGNRIEKGDSSMCYVPGPGKIYVHGLKHVYEKIMKNKDPLSHIPTDNPTNNGNYMGTTTHPTDPKLTKSVGNNHPTVKPVALMKYLIKLVTPPNSIVMDPFMGSGSTGMAAEELGHEFIGIELDANYCDIASKRITAWNKPQSSNNNYGELFYETSGSPR